MKIGIDGACLANRRGFGRFAREIVDGLARVAEGRGHEFVLFMDRPSVGTVEVPQGFRVHPVPVRVAPAEAASSDGRRSVLDLLAMSRAVRRERPDVMYFPASYSFFPPLGARRTVVTMYDTLPLDHPWLVFPSWKGRLAWTVKERAAARWADQIVTMSETARRDLCRWFPLEYRSIRVVSGGIHPRFRPPLDEDEGRAVFDRLGIPVGTRYLIAVGGLSPHKNLPRLIRAFGRTSGPEDRLVLVGDLGDVFLTHVPEIRSAVAAGGLEGRVHLTGFVSDEDLVHLYQRAYALAQPSLMEGFGLPPVEAMACGIPVLSSFAGSLPEVVGPSGVYFDPTDEDAMAGAIRRLLRDPVERDRLAGAALEWTRRYSWDRTAKAVLDCLEGAPSQPAQVANPPHWERKSRNLTNLGRRPLI